MGRMLAPRGRSGGMRGGGGERGRCARGLLDRGRGDRGRFFDLRPAILCLTPTCEKKLSEEADIPETLTKLFEQAKDLKIIDAGNEQAMKQNINTGEFTVDHYIGNLQTSINAKRKANAALAKAERSAAVKRDVEEALERARATRLAEKQLATAIKDADAELESTAMADAEAALERVRRDRGKEEQAE